MIKRLNGIKQALVPATGFGRPVIESFASCTATRPSQYGGVRDNVRRMQAARLHGTGDLRVADEPAPQPGEGATLVRVTAVGICGSDLHWWTEGAIGDATLSRPLVLGHEGAGVVAAGP